MRFKSRVTVDGCMGMEDVIVDQLTPLPYRPAIVCLCGSTKFKAEFLKAQERLTFDGKIVLSVGTFGHADGTADRDGDLKKRLDELHLRKIDLADEVFVINARIPYCAECREFRLKVLGCTGEHGFKGVMRAYVGESTGREIAYARSKGKPVTLLNPEE